jgi:hypothetical protein
VGVREASGGGGVTTVPFRTESQEQIAVARLLSIYQEQGKITLYSKLAQETYTKFITVRRRNRMEGLIEGVPDLIVVLPEKLLFIEMKRVKKAYSYPTLSQKMWLEALDHIPNVYAQVCYGFDEAKAFIDSHIEGEGVSI